MLAVAYLLFAFLLLLSEAITESEQTAEGILRGRDEFDLGEGFPRWHQSWMLRME